MDEGRNMCLIFPELIDLGSTEEEHLVRRKVFEIKYVFKFSFVHNDILSPLEALIAANFCQDATSSTADDWLKCTMANQNGPS